MASLFIPSIIESRYKLPFVSIPVKSFFSNHKSTLDNRAFVCEAIKQLLLTGSAVEVKPDQTHVCNPLGVVPKKYGKLPLILDLRFFNKHLVKHRFKFKDLCVAPDILQPDDCFFYFCKSQPVRGDLDCLGLLVNEEKSNFEPHEKGEHLDFHLDLAKGEFSIPPSKIDHPLNLISLLLDNVSLSYHVSCITGTLISMERILGPVVCLHTPAL